MTGRYRRLLGAFAAVGLFAALAACGGGSDDSGASAGGGSIKKIPALEGVTFKLSDKTYTENALNEKMTALALEAAGAKVDYLPSFAAAEAARQALVAGQIDMYWEGMASGWVGYLGNSEPFDTVDAMYAALSKQDLEENGIKWLPPAPFNDTYAIAAKSETADDLGVHSLSDLANLTKTNPDEATICIETEFQTRNDGLPGMSKAYGMDFPSDNVKVVDAGVVYTEVAKADTCNFGEIYSTDGRVKGLGLTVLDDDKGFFPIYNPALTMKNSLFEKYPEIEDLMAPIQAKWTADVQTALNAKVDVDGETVDQVAEDWMKEQGFIG
ncbi:MAG: glycine betaine ABC transporter substrate-binding protein [Nocardioides sp.]|uniref:glycine betaine ABC transporter substrate-binding protein n=1 Tax=Nocardioides sp. TaxID=35761 RepID=UPI0039E2974F